MASDKPNSIDSMGFEELLAAMRTLGLSFNGVKTDDDMKTRINAALNGAEKTSSWSAIQVRYLLLYQYFETIFAGIY